MPSRTQLEEMDIGWVSLPIRVSIFFLQLAADSIEDVNQQVDCDNISYSRKAMICCGMALALYGTWSVAQLFPHLQESVAKHLQYFQGQDVLDNVRAA
jgi:hypothetical protein